eukprot:1150228-Rhodomonas_salina.2
MRLGFCVRTTGAHARTSRSCRWGYGIRSEISASLNHSSGAFGSQYSPVEGKTSGSYASTKRSHAQTKRETAQNRDESHDSTHASKQVSRASGVGGRVPVGDGDARVLVGEVVDLDRVLALGERDHAADLLVRMQPAVVDEQRLVDPQPRAV